MPATKFEERVTLPPAQNVVEPLAEMDEETAGLTVTDVVATVDVQPFTVAVTEYVPLIDVVALPMAGFCCDTAKLFGPVHEYVAPATVVALSWIVPPLQYGPPFDATGAAGRALTTTVVDPAAEVQPFAVTVTEYVPASAVVTLERVGFWSAEVKPFGPVHV